MPQLDPATAIRARRPGWQLRDFRLAGLRPRRTRYCVCVFVLNEGERIRAQLWRMAVLPPVIDIIVADGGSSDGALELELVRSAQVRALASSRPGPAA